MSARISGSAFALILGAFAFAQPSSALQEAKDPAAATPASVIVFNQKLDGSSVKLTYLYAPAKSFAVVYGSTEAGRHGGKALGTLAVEPGDHRDIKIPIKANVKPGETLWISLYRNDDGSKSFDSKEDVSYWPAGDLPSANGFIVQ